MTEPDTIRTVLEAKLPPVADVRTALAIAGERVISLRSAASEAEEAALDPLARNPAKAKADADAARWEADRAAVAVSRLEALLERRVAETAEDQRRAAYDRAKAAQSMASDLIRTTYPDVARQLADIIEAINVANDLRDTANSDLPADADFLPSSEDAAGRGALIGSNAEPRIVEMVVPNPVSGGIPLWAGAWRPELMTFGSSGRLSERDALSVWRKKKQIDHDAEARIRSAEDVE